MPGTPARSGTVLCSLWEVCLTGRVLLSPRRWVPVSEQARGQVIRDSCLQSQALLPCGRTLEMCQEASWSTSQAMDPRGLQSRPQQRASPRTRAAVGLAAAHVPAGLILRVPRALPFHQSPTCVQPCVCLRVCHTALCVT